MQDRLLNRNFVMICLSNLAVCIAFFMTLPVMPLYLIDHLGASKSMAGLIVALYTIGALVVRPFSGPVVDRLQRKPVLVITVLFFAVSCSGYIWVASLFLIGVVRVVHGMSFSFSSTSMSTVAVDNMPLSKLGTGIGIFGMIISLSMALAPMVGLHLMNNFSASAPFIGSAAFALLGLLLALPIKAPRREIPPKKGPLFTPGNLVLKEGLLPAACYLLTIFSYGLLSNYVALLAKERGMEESAGVFFIFLSAGMVCTRFFSGMLLDKGYLGHVIMVGKAIVIAAFTYMLLGTGVAQFFSAGLLLGLGFGMCMPAYQGLIISLAGKDRIGTANSTFSLSMDIGIGLAVLSGGMIADFTSLDATYTVGIVFVALSLVLFMAKIRPIIRANKSPSKGGVEAQV